MTIGSLRGLRNLCLGHVLSASVRDERRPRPWEGSYESRMPDIPTLRKLAHSLIIHHAGNSPDSEVVALSAVAVYAKFLTSVSALLGETGSTALFGRSIKLTEMTFPFYAQARIAEGNGLLNAVQASLRTQPSQVALDASVALFTRYLDLLSTFIGEPLTRQLFEETWPDLLRPPSHERHP